MLLRIKPEDAEIGMFVHAFEGSWFDHPFWRRRFRIETAEEVRRIRDSSIEQLVIDPSRGRGMADIQPTAEVAAKPRYAAARRAGAALPSRAAIGAAPAFGLPQPLARDAVRRRRSYASERRRARRLIDKTRQAIVDLFAAARAGGAIEARRMGPLARKVGDSIERDARALIDLVRLKEKDEYTYLHSVAVCALMMNFARHLGLDDDVVQDLGVAGLLHDVGKVAVADEILNKPGSLSSGELHMVREHPAAGRRLLEQSDDIPEAALEVCLRHHEKIDGTGYPHALAGDELSLFARMGAICDVYDAVTSDRPYKQAWTPCEALTAMEKWDGHFDPPLLEAFADSLGIYAVGTLVRLSTGELGVVAGSGGEVAENMIVRAFFDCDALAECAPVDRIIAPSSEHPRITGRASPGFWRFDDWDAVRLRVLAAVVAPAAS